MKLTTKQRNRLADSAFAGPNRSYPVDTKARAVNAKGRAQQQYDKGNITAGLLAQIDRKANKVIGPGRKNNSAKRK